MFFSYRSFLKTFFILVSLALVIIVFSVAGKIRNDGTIAIARNVKRSLIQMKHKILEKAGFAFDLMTCKMFNVRTAVIRVRGGLADQIGWYGYGSLLHERCHVSVEYKFETHIDDTHDFPHLPRMLQLKDAFPSIELREHDSRLKDPYARIFRHRNLAAHEYGISVLKNKFCPIDVDTCKDLLNDINAHKSCAVHVRRDDYARGAGGTHPTQAEFFILAVNKIHSLDPNVKFFFFSDDCGWVRERILPALDGDIACRVCDQNDSSKGYLDLYCISRCDHVICSLGGFGHAGRLFSYKKGYYLRGIASDEYHFSWSLKMYDGEKIGEEIEYGRRIDVRELGKTAKTAKN